MNAVDLELMEMHSVQGPFDKTSDMANTVKTAM